MPSVCIVSDLRDPFGIWPRWIGFGDQGRVGGSYSAVSGAAGNKKINPVDAVAHTEEEVLAAIGQADVFIIRKPIPPRPLLNKSAPPGVPAKISGAG